MDDRIPTPGQEGRVLITPEDGTVPFYAKISMADNPTQPGTPLNKATLLKDATALRFGLTTEAVPDDVFSFLGKYNLYWWKRRTYQSEWVTETENITVNDDNAPSWFVITIFDSYGSYDVRYANNIQVSDSGEISLLNPQTVSVDDRDSGGAINVIAGKYCAQMRYDDGETGKIFFIPSGQSGNKEIRGNTYYWYFTNTRNITSKLVEEIGEWEYVQSSNREAYPDSGISGGYEYQFLGVPFDNAATSVKIETGSYVGTGTFGASNPNSLTLPWKPVFVIIARPSELLWPLFVPGILTSSYANNAYQLLGNQGILDDGYAKFEGNVLSWYAANALTQGNSSGITYTYAAFGI